MALLVLAHGALPVAHDAEDVPALVRRARVFPALLHVPVDDLEGFRAAAAPRERLREVQAMISSRGAASRAALRKLTAPAGSPASMAQLTLEVVHPGIRRREAARAVERLPGIASQQVQGLRRGGTGRAGTRAPAPRRGRGAAGASALAPLPVRMIPRR